MGELLYKDSVNFYISITGLLIAIFDFTGISSSINKLFCKLKEDIEYFIFTDKTGLSEMLGEAGEYVYDNYCLSVFQACKEVIQLAIGLFLWIFLGVLIYCIISIFTFGLGFILAAFFSGIAIVIVEVVLVVIAPFFVYYVLLPLALLFSTIFLLFFIIYLMLRISQPIALSFPWTFLLPFYWIFRLLDFFPGKTLGTIGLVVSILSTISAGYQFSVKW